MSTETTVAPFLHRTCVGLDVHQKTITARLLHPGGVLGDEWKVKTTNAGLEELRTRLPADIVIGLEASTTGKAVCRQLRQQGLRVLMASPRQLRAITSSDVKTDKRDAEHLARLVQANYFPESYLPPPDIDEVRGLVRFRMRLGQDVTMAKNRARAVVLANLLQERMDPYSNWFGKAGLLELARLPLSPTNRRELKAILEHLAVLASQEEMTGRELARVGKDRKDVQLLMTIPGIDVYSALAFVGEIGDIHRFPSKRHFCSYAGVVPGASNSGEKVSEHRRVKRGDPILKFFLTTAVTVMRRWSMDNAVVRFYNKKAKSMPPQKASVAAARKLAAIVWKILTVGEPYAEEDEQMTDRKVARMEARARKEAPEVTEEDLVALATSLGEKEDILRRVEELAPTSSPDADGGES